MYIIVIICIYIIGEISDNLRLMPRHTAEEYHSSLKDTFFGTSSIESFLLNRIITSCRATPVNSRLGYMYKYGYLYVDIHAYIHVYTYDIYIFK